MLQGSYLTALAPAHTSSDDSGIKLVLPVEFVIRASCGCGATEVPTRRATQAKA
jgi:hypothetical protein